MNTSILDLTDKNLNEIYSDEKIRDAMELLFFSYRDFISQPDTILNEYGFGRAHHRVIHFVGRNPSITVSNLLDILKITKQSLSRVLSQLIQEELVKQIQGPMDRRERLLTLTKKGFIFEEKVSMYQRRRIVSAFNRAGPIAVNGFYDVLLNMLSDVNEFKKYEEIYGGKLK
jgi:DNA-binding MarR family transcriptional regulator